MDELRGSLLGWIGHWGHHMAVQELLTLGMCLHFSELSLPVHEMEEMILPWDS